ncbi:sodium:solute symporter family protein [Caldibacillus lycopersici]|uniref:Sodium:solute symporter family protein n=1 Tax=Perspicuibacillus lycopersici TaxID=1325689 RepID=A0AAE3ISN9_9BACI|nr:sodium:solute symporter family protein [Perspicuibacillus lycopersici]MCU9612711.1 sodium:solute symporter family protein [Perspicuibacillus lycopersici]
MDQAIFHPKFIDYLIIGVYFIFVILVGVALKGKMKTGNDFFLSGRSIPGWITSLAFLSANLGALEMLGMVASGYQYGIMTVHYYLIGAIPAMVFLGIFMMPFYYGSKVRSVPEYLKKRYNEATRGFNAISFAVMTVLMSGISLYAMALILKVLLGWSMTLSIVLAAVIVLIYVGIGGLTSSIYNEVIQFFLIWIGLLPITILSLRDVGGWNGLLDRLPENFSHIWEGTATAAGNGMSVDFLGIVLGLGFVLSFGYWTTDFLVVQRAMAAKDMAAAQNTSIIASFPKMLMPILTVVPGMAAILLLPQLGPDSLHGNYDMALPLLMAKYYPTGLLGLGITALLASFMSGMAGNVTAFTTIWTYDIYQAYINKKASDKHYLFMGRISTVVGIIISIGTAYIVMGFPNMMDYMQTLFGFFNAPLFAVFLLGMFWKKASPWGGFWGLLSGTLTAGILYLFLPEDFYASAAAGNFWRAWWAFFAAIVIEIIVSLFTKQKKESELVGLVYGLTEKISHKHLPWYRKPTVLGSIAMIVFIALNIWLF